MHRVLKSLDERGWIFLQSEIVASVKLFEIYYLRWISEYIPISTVGYKRDLRAKIKIFHLSNINLFVALAQTFFLIF